MLVLTRKVNEVIRIGPTVQVEVKEIRRNQVRLGIQAPEDIPIHREEIFEDIQSEEVDRPCLFYKGTWLDIPEGLSVASQLTAWACGRLGVSLKEHKLLAHTDEDVLFPGRMDRLSKIDANHYEMAEMAHREHRT